MHDKKRGLLFAFAAVLLFSTFGVGLKLSVLSLNALSIAIIIEFLSTLALFLWLLIRGRLGLAVKELSSHPLFYVFAGILGLGIQTILYIWGFELLPASQAVMTFYLYPLLMIILSNLFYKEKTSFESGVFVLIGFFGLLILVTEGRTDFVLSKGIILIILSAISWAFFSEIIKHKEFEVDVGFFLFNLMALIFLILLVPFYGVSFGITAGGFLILLYLAVFTTVIGCILWDEALHFLETHLCSDIILLTPLFSILWISLVFHEKISMIRLVGFVIMMVSVFLELRVGGRHVRRVHHHTR